MKSETSIGNRLDSNPRHHISSDAPCAQRLIEKNENKQFDLSDGQSTKMKGHHDHNIENKSLSNLIGNLSLN